MLGIQPCSICSKSPLGPLAALGVIWWSWHAEPSFGRFILAAILALLAASVVNHALVGLYRLVASKDT